MQVITLNPQAFEEHASRLAEAVADCGEDRYDAIVGIRRGGSIVCDAFLRHFPTDKAGERFDISLQRPSTKHKGGNLNRLLKHLPYSLLNGMRMAEAYVLAAHRKIKGPSHTPDVEMEEGLKKILATNDKARILVIDDAIDSGDTLWAIVDTLRKTNPEATVETAVMTETTLHPRIRSTYTLYRNRTLIRFPWSNDYKTP